MLAAPLAGMPWAACRSAPPPLRIGGRTGTEGTVLCEAAAQLVEKRLGRRVERNYNLGDSLQAHQAILTGAVDAYPEYAAPALAQILQVELASEPAAASERVRSEYLRRFQLEWLPPLGFDNRVVMTVRAPDAARLKLAKLSDIEKPDAGWALAANRAFTVSRWGLPALTKGYRVRFSKPAALLEPREVYKALGEGTATLAAGFATDADLARGEFRPLADDRNIFAANPACFVLRRESGLRFPGLRNALEELSGKVTLERMREMNRAVELEGKPAAAAAAAFLAGAGL